MTREIRTTRENLQPQPINPQHQEEVVRREQAFKQEDAQQVLRILPRPQTEDHTVRKPQVPRVTRRTERMDRHDNLWKMEQELKGALHQLYQPQKVPT
jgi:hypothetical protein